MAPPQKKEGYDPAFSAAVNIASCPTGLLIPPSSTLIVYTLITGGTSIAALFVARYVPGILMGLSLMELAINIALLVVGTFMDMTPALLIFTPIYMPVVSDLGMDPVHFGIVMTFNLYIGICTPPVGSALLIGCSVGGTSIGKVI